MSQELFRLDSTPWTGNTESDNPSKSFIERMMNGGYLLNCWHWHTYCKRSRRHSAETLGVHPTFLVADPS